MNERFLTLARACPALPALCRFERQASGSKTPRPRCIIDAKPTLDVQMERSYSVSSNKISAIALGEKVGTNDSCSLDAAEFLEKLRADIYSSLVHSTVWIPYLSRSSCTSARKSWDKPKCKQPHR
jgi:hypothetical protein